MISDRPQQSAASPNGAAAAAPELATDALEIAIVTETYAPQVNGVAGTLLRLAQGLAARGHGVRVYRPRCAAGESVQTPDDLTAGIGITRGWPLPRYPGLCFGLPAGRALAGAWRERRPNVVYIATEGPLGWSALRVARAGGIPVVAGFHTQFHVYSRHYGWGFLAPAVLAYLRAFHGRALRNLVATEALAAALARQGFRGLGVLGRGVDTALFHPARRSAALRAAWGLSDAALAVGYVGRIAPEKNPELALAAFARIHALHPDSRLIWVGDGPAVQRLRPRHPAQQFCGLRRGEDLAAHYAALDLFLFPSLTETYGNVVAEALASGVAVVAYDDAAARVLIRTEVEGLLAEPGNAEQFIAQALRLAGDAAARRRMAGAGRTRAEAQGWGAICTRFEAYLHAAAQGRDAAPLTSSGARDAADTPAEPAKSRSR